MENYTKQKLFFTEYERLVKQVKDYPRHYKKRNTPKIMRLKNILVNHYKMTL